VQYNELLIFVFSRADFNCLRDDFTKLYEKDFPQLQRCIEKLHNIIRTFEKDFRRATKATRGGGVVGIGGGVGLIAGLFGSALAPFTFKASLVVAGVLLFRISILSLIQIWKTLVVTAWSE